MKLLPRLKDNFTRERFSVGLDIGTLAVKLVKLRFLKEAVELCDFVLEPAQVDLEPLLKRITQSKDIDNVATSVSGPSVIIRYVNFPKMNTTELKQALKFEAAKYIPFPISELSLDAYILKQDLADNKMLVLLAGVKKELLNQRLKLIEGSGFKASVVDIDSLALINAFNFNYSQDPNLKSKTIALINIGAQLSNLSILEDGTPRLSRDIHIAGNNFTQKLQDALSLDFKSAEELKLNPDKERLNDVFVALEPVFSNLAAEVRVSFDYYESQSASSVEKIFLSGGGSLFSGLNGALVNLLGITVEHWDPLKQIDIANNIDSQKVKALSSQLAVAVGLALRQ